MAESGRSLNGGFQVHRVKALPWPRAKAPLEGWRGSTASFIMKRAGGLLPRYQQSLAANTCNRDTQRHQACSGKEPRMRRRKAVEIVDRPWPGHRCDGRGSEESVRGYDEQRPGAGKVLSECAPRFGEAILLKRVHRASMSDEQDRHLAHSSEEHTSELQSLMRISYAVFCLKKK